MKALIFAALVATSAGALAAGCVLPAGGAASAALIAACRSDLADTEAELDRTYRRLRAQTGLERRVQLGKAQQAWLAYRAAQCAFVSGAAPGSSNIGTIVCAAALNRDRIGQLEDALAAED